jgi:acetylornithine deacetylase/succinyl-diaminopimelate desuccinylase-like protein
VDPVEGLRQNGRLAWKAALGLGALVAPAMPAAAQAPPRALAPVLESLRRTNEWTLEQQVSICEIPAPPFGEAARAAAFRDRLRAAGLADVRLDTAGNVIARRAGTGTGPTLVLAAHLDTVFPESTDVRVRRSGSRFEGPGIADDCRGLAMLLAIARALEQHRVRTAGTILFVGTVGEEGLGNLRGVRNLFHELKDEIDAFVTLDAVGYSIANRAVGSRRYRVTVRGPGGHSWSDFGTPSAVHALARAAAAVADLDVPASPRTTFNAGVIRGGTSVNAVAAEASFDLDLRSVAPGALAELDEQAQRVIRAAVAAEEARWPASGVRLSLAFDTLGIRPAGTLADTARLVRVAAASARMAGITPIPASISTDANLPLSLGVPALALGIGGTSAGEHSLDESYDDGADGWRAVQWAALVAVSYVGLMP